MSRHGHQKFSTSPGFVGKLTTSLLVFCLISFSTPSLRAEDGGFNPDGDKSEGNADELNVSSKIVQCEKWALLTGQDWSQIAGDSYISKIGPRSANILSESIFKNPGGVDSVDKYYQYVGSYLARVSTCEIYGAITWQENYSSENAETFGKAQKSDSSNSSSSALATCVSKSTAEEQQSCVQQAQSQKDLNCKYKGWETHDYLKCKEIITWLQGFTIGETAMQIQQTYRQGVQQNDAYEDLINKQNSDDGITVTDTLEHEQEAYEQKGNMAYEMAAYKASQAGILLALIDDFPNAEKMNDICTQKTIDTNTFNYEELYTNLIEKHIGSSPLNEITRTVFPDGYEHNTTKLKEQYFKYLKSVGGFSGKENASANQKKVELCAHLVSDNNQFLLNTKVRDTMKQVAIEAGLAAVAQGANGALLHDQAEIIGDAIDEIEEYEEPEWGEATFTSSVSECLVDEDAEGCELTSGTSASGFGSQSFNSSLSGSAELGDGSITTGSGSGSSSASATDRDTLADSFGSVQIGSASDNSFQDGTVAAGSIKGGAAGSGSGAGGGAAGGSASRPGGGGGSSNGGGGKLASSSKKSAVNIGRSGSGLGSIAGGRGSIGKKVSSSDNPFAKLLGKSSATGSSTLNFRTPSSEIGSSKGTIFQMISSRYKAVSESDKLIKYEEAE